MSVTSLVDDAGFEARSNPNPVAATFAAAARAVVMWRTERARRLALADLLSMEPHRLHDLGISVHDVREAMRDGGAH